MKKSLCLAALFALVECVCVGNLAVIAYLKRGDTVGHCQ